MFQLRTREAADVWHARPAKQFAFREKAWYYKCSPGEFSVARRGLVTSEEKKRKLM